MRNLTFIFIILISIISCDTTTKRSEKIKHNESISNIKYSIIREDKITNEKYSVDIRLEKEYMKSDLEEFAYFIKNNVKSGNYKRIFISYYLPNMNVGQGAWATSHFNPDLEIIMSSPFFDDSKENDIVNVSKTDKAINEFIKQNGPCEIIGKWDQGYDMLMFIFKKNGKYNLKEININTLRISRNFELLVKNLKGKQVFIIKEFIAEGYTDYYLIESNGDLALFDNIGLIEKYGKIN